MGIIIFCVFFLISVITVWGYMISGEVRSTEEQGQVKSQQDGKVTVRLNSGKIVNITILKKSGDGIHLPTQFLENFRQWIDDYKSFNSMKDKYLQFYKINDKYYVGQNCLYDHFYGQYRCGEITSSLVYDITLSCVILTGSILVYIVCGLIILIIGFSTIAGLGMMMGFGIKLIYDGFTTYINNPYS